MATVLLRAYIARAAFKTYKQAQSMPGLMIMQGADQTPIVHELLLWDYISHQVKHPAFAKITRLQQSKPAAAAAQTSVGKQPLVLNNMSATCLEEHEGQPGQTLPAIWLCALALLNNMQAGDKSSKII